MPSFFKKKSQKGKKTAEKQKKPAVSSPLSEVLEENLAVITSKTGNSTDIIIRRLKHSPRFKTESAIVYLKGLTDTQTVQEILIESLMKSDPVEQEPSSMQEMVEGYLPLGIMESLKDWETLFQALMSGHTIIFVDGFSEAMSTSTEGGEQRSIEEPSTQRAIRGSREGFTESIETNISMVRRIIQNPTLWTETMTIGRVTKTKVTIMYIKGIARDDIIEELRNRLKKIDIDSVLESGYIEQYIEDQSLTVFPTLYHSERPDVVAGNLLEGRFALFVNGSPFVLLGPVVFIQFFQSIEDYTERFYISTALRLLRVLIFFISLIGPATYIAATTFHQEMIPTQLLVAIAAQRESVPFPSFVEAIIMEVTFEILREAGIRMPKAIGSAISIVGALVIGQAAVQAGVVSAAMVIIVAITAIASFATPSFGIAISTRLLRFLFMISAATFGFYGMILGFIILVVHLCGLRSFGVPYMSPLAPFVPADINDTVIRGPLWADRKRPSFMSGQNQLRQGEETGRPEPDKSRQMVTKNEGDAQ
ncbi:spore germination protein KA [Fictibacillus enclensis]|uniref:Spore gernimation protein KB n=1 Tax=Fictibacillus enclensis TaxID=1017270 RepID=A0A0V8J4P0_9BACL|nr:spore germination protein [Fictibacillus enclensis]KSU81939.1 spore gernimation protein KB [Fictibacillus enclensis]SCC28138.1 spore germination protein KA [Fictibacillus enclensis]